MKVGRIEFRHRSEPVATQTLAMEQPMGAVRIKVNLVNGSDEALMIEGKLKPEQVRRCEAVALVDTGSTHSAIPRDVFEKLGLGQAAVIDAVYADGSPEEVPLTTPIRFYIDGRNTSDDAAVLGDEVLIGQTILEKLDLLVDCRNLRVISNPRHPDGPAFRI